MFASTVIKRYLTWCVVLISGVSGSFRVFDPIKRESWLQLSWKSPLSKVKIKIRPKFVYFFMFNINTLIKNPHSIYTQHLHLTPAMSCLTWWEKWFLKSSKKLSLNDPRNTRNQDRPHQVRYYRHFLGTVMDTRNDEHSHAKSWTDRHCDRQHYNTLSLGCLWWKTFSELLQNLNNEIEV